MLVSYPNTHPYTCICEFRFSNPARSGSVEANFFLSRILFVNVYYATSVWPFCLPTFANRCCAVGERVGGIIQVGVNIGNAKIRNVADVTFAVDNIKCISNRKNLGYNWNWQNFLMSEMALFWLAEIPAIFDKKRLWFLIPGITNLQKKIFVSKGLIDPH